jgi:predicted secreted protein
MASSAVKGSLMTLSIEGDALAECRSLVLHFSQASIDVTSRDNNTWEDFIAGRRGWTVDFEGMYIYTDVGYKVLQNHFTDQSPAALTLIITMPDAKTFTGEAILESMDLNAPYDDVLSISGTLKGQGTLTESAS